MNDLMSKLPSSFKNFSKFSDAKLQAELSRCIYSLQGLEPLMRPAFGVVCHLLITVSNCMPGSAHSHAASANWRIMSRASTVFTTLPVLTARSSHLPPSCTACMNSSVTRTELLAFWYCTCLLYTSPSPRDGLLSRM